MALLFWALHPQERSVMSLMLATTMTAIEAHIMTHGGNQPGTKYISSNQFLAGTWTTQAHSSLLLEAHREIIQLSLPLSTQPSPHTITDQPAHMEMMVQV